MNLGKLLWMQDLARNIPVWVAIHTRDDDRIHVAAVRPKGPYSVRVIGTDHRDVDPVGEIPLDHFEELISDH